MCCHGLYTGPRVRDAVVAVVATVASLLIPAQAHVAGNWSKLDFTHVKFSNLGGNGPDKDALHGIRYTNVATESDKEVDVIVAVRGNEKVYSPSAAENNGKVGEFGRINVMGGSHVDLLFMFFDPDTAKPVWMDQFYFSIYNLGQTEGDDTQQQRVSVDGFTAFCLPGNAEVDTKHKDDSMLLATLASSAVSNTDDTSFSPSAPTREQMRHAASFKFEGVSNFAVRLEVAGPPSPTGRDFLFAGVPFDCNYLGEDGVKWSSTSASTTAAADTASAGTDTLAASTTKQVGSEPASTTQAVTTSSAATSRATTTASSAAATTTAEPDTADSSWGMDSLVGAATGTHHAETDCYENNTSWEPLDMENAAATKEVTAFTCQMRCERKPGCVHFSFWKLQEFAPRGICHLQDAYAMRSMHRIGFRSGPAHCWRDIKDKQVYMRYDKFTYLPHKFGCVELRTLYTPIMGVPTLLPTIMPRWDAIMRCQSICKTTPGCAHFTLQFPQSCRLAGAGARQVHMATAVSGSPNCTRVHTDEKAAWGITLRKKFLVDAKLFTQPNSRILTLAAAVLLTASFSCAVFALHRAGRHPEVRMRLGRVQMAATSHSRDHISNLATPFRRGFRLLDPEVGNREVHGTYIDESPRTPMAAE